MFWSTLKIDDFPRRFVDLPQVFGFPPLASPQVIAPTKTALHPVLFRAFLGLTIPGSEDETDDPSALDDRGGQVGVHEAS